MLPPVASRVLSEHVLRMFFLVAVVFGLASLGKLPQRTMSNLLHLLYSLYTNRLVRFVGRNGHGFCCLSFLVFVYYAHLSK